MQDATGHPQSVAVFGGGSDIALATVRELVGRRTRTVVLAGRDAARFEPHAAEVRRLGATTVDIVDFDALDVDSHPAVVEKVFSSHGDIDLVLLAFGVLGDQDRAEEDVSHAVEVYRTNAVASASVALLCAQRLRAQGHGTLVALSTVAAERPRRANFVYGSSKAALDSLAHGLGDALVGTGVRVMVVRPGFVRTKMTAHLKPAPFATTPDDVARAIVRGLETGAETIWVPPVLRWVMAAVRHLPRAVFRRLRM